MNLFNCQMSIFLAYTMTIYCTSSLYYLIFSRFAGTPFSNSLSQQQLKLKQTSSGKRKNIFIQGIIVSIIMLYYWTPFSNCVTT